MIAHRVVVFEKFLDHAPFGGHGDHAVHGIEGGDGAFGRASSVSWPKAQERTHTPHPMQQLGIDESEALAGRTVFHVDRIDRTDLFTLAAPPAIVPGAGDEVGMDGPGDGEPAWSPAVPRNSTAAVADEVHAFTGVFAKLDEVVPLRHGEQIKALGGVHLPGVAVFDERAGRGVEGHADVHWGITRPPEMLHFMAAVAHADARCARPS